MSPVTKVLLGRRLPVSCVSVRASMSYPSSLHSSLYVKESPPQFQVANRILSPILEWALCWDSPLSIIITQRFVFVNKTCTFCLTRQHCHSDNHSLIVYTANTVTNMCQYSYLNWLCVEIHHYPLLSPSGLCLWIKHALSASTGRTVIATTTPWQSTTVYTANTVPTCVNTRRESHVAAFAVMDSQMQNTLDGWTRNREGRELVELLRRNGLAVANTFFQKKESHTITYRSGRHKRELDLLVVRQQQLRRVREGLQSVGGRVCHHTAQTGRLWDPHSSSVVSFTQFPVPFWRMLARLPGCLYRAAVCCFSQTSRAA